MTPEEYFLFAIAIICTVSVIISYFRLRRRSDRQFGKGWRKKVWEDMNKPFD